MKVIMLIELLSSHAPRTPYIFIFNHNDNSTAHLHISPIHTTKVSTLYIE